MQRVKVFLFMLILTVFITNIFATMEKKPMRNQLIENMTWLEVEKAQKNNQVVIIPLGAAAKEHGLHLPLNNDYIMANYLRDRVLKKMPHALALPTINYSYYPAFLEYPGSASVNSTVARDMVVDICASLANQGFRRFYVLNTGFGTIKPLQEAKELLKQKNIAMEYLSPPDFFNSPQIKKLEQQKYGSHADEIETSMMLYIGPKIVDMKKTVKPDEVEEISPGPLTRDPNSKDGFYSPTGSFGDPTLATRKKGEIITEAYVEYILKDMQRFMGQQVEMSADPK